MTPSLVERYADPGWYRIECERVLAVGWLPVCRADQIAQPGDRFAVELIGRPVVAIRDAGGSVGVLANVCAHRGSVVVDDGPTSGSTLVCPYHRWAYRLDGTFIGGPLTDGADLDEVCLPHVRHAEWEGFVLVDFSGTAPDPSVLYGGLSDRIQPWAWSELVTVGSRTFESDWNWKVMVENWIECYHHVGTHRTSIEPYQPARTTRIEPSDGEPWVAMTVDSVDGMAGPAEGWIPGLSPKRANELSVWSAFPLLLGGSTARVAFWLHIVPIDVRRHRVTWYLLAHPSRLASFDAERITNELDSLAAVHAEDMVACASVQRGLESGLIDEFRLTRLESPIGSFHDWLDAGIGRE